MVDLPSIGKCFFELIRDGMLPVYFVSHGGGPWPYMQQEYGDQYALMTKTLRDIPKYLGAAPEAILMISAHWEEKQATLQSNLEPPMLYDYGGFPKHTYEVKYPAKGSLALVERCEALLKAAGIASARDAKSGYDHGAFVPLVVMYCGQGANCQYTNHPRGNKIKFHNYFSDLD